MGWHTYVDAVVRHGRRYFYLQRVDDDLAGPHPVLVGTNGRLGFYASEAEARAAAKILDEQLELETPYVDDRDAVQRWATDARAESIDYALLMVAWHTLIHMNVLEPMSDELDLPAPESALSEISDKIHLGHDVASNPESPFVAPIWRPDEVLLLANTLLRGLAGLDELLQHSAMRDA